MGFNSEAIILGALNILCEVSFVEFRDGRFQSVVELKWNDPQ